MATIFEPGVTAQHPAPLGEYAPAPEPSVIEVSLLDILLVIARRLRFIAAITLAFTAIGALLAFTRTPVYTATTVILPPQQSGAGAGVAAELSSLGALGGLAGGGLGLKNPADQYVALFRSKTVEDAMIKQFDLQREYHQKLFSNARAAFEGSSKVIADGKSGLIAISYTDPDPKRAATIANAYIEQYRRLSGNLAISEAAQRRLFFQQQLVDAKNSLANAEEALMKTEQTKGLVEIGSQARALIESASSLRAQIAAKQVQIEGMQTYAAQDNAGLVQAQQELAGLRAQLAKLGGNGDVNGNDLIVTGGRVPAASLEYARKLRDVKYNETIFNILARQFEAAKLDEAREGALVQVVDPATPPDWKSAPKRLTWLVVSFGMGLVFSCGLVLVQAALRLLRRDPEIDRKLTAIGSAVRPFRRERHA